MRRLVGHNIIFISLRQEPSFITKPGRRKDNAGVNIIWTISKETKLIKWAVAKYCSSKRRQVAFSTFSFLGKVFSTYLASLFTPKGGGAKWALLKKDVKTCSSWLTQHIYTMPYTYIHRSWRPPFLLFLSFQQTYLMGILCFRQSFDVSDEMDIIHKWTKIRCTGTWWQILSVSGAVAAPNHRQNFLSGPGTIQLCSLVVCSIIFPSSLCM